MTMGRCEILLKRYQKGWSRGIIKARPMIIKEQNRKAAALLRSKVREEGMYGEQDDQFEANEEDEADEANLRQRLLSMPDMEESSMQATGSSEGAHGKRVNSPMLYDDEDDPDNLDHVAASDLAKMLAAHVDEEEDSQGGHDWWGVVCYNNTRDLHLSHATSNSHDMASSCDCDGDEDAP